MSQNNHHMPERRRGTGEGSRKQRRQLQMIFASYGGGERPIVIREGDKQQPHVTIVGATASPISTPKAKRRHRGGRKHRNNRQRFAIAA